LLNKRQSLKIITRYLLAALANASRRNKQTLQLPLLPSPVAATPAYNTHFTRSPEKGVYQEAYIIQNMKDIHNMKERKKRRK